MNYGDQTRTRSRLGLLFAVPIAFALMFFLVDVAEEHTDTRHIDVLNLTSDISDLRALADDAQAGERGYLLNQDETYLSPLRHANAVLEPEIMNCWKSAAQHPEIQPKLNSLIALIRKNIGEANKIVQASRNDIRLGLEAGRSDSQRRSMEMIRMQSSDLLKALRKEDDEYMRVARSYRTGAYWFFLIGSIVTLSVTIWLYNELVSYLAQRDAAQIEVQRANQELESRIAERTHELQRANDELKLTNEELQQFAYVASHDLQEPLRTITSFSQLLETRYKGQLDEDADEFIGFIITASRRMSDLINGLLALVRLRKTGQPVEPIRLETLLQDAEVSLQASIRENDAHIVYGSLPALVVDRVQFSQVFQNLISNAIKYRRDATPKVEISAERNSSNWIIKVSDNGRGFKQEYAERIFALFQRLQSRDVEGTGMGLAITRRIVERHGGRIWAESQEGVGSRFYISLPISLEGYRTEDTMAHAASHS